MNGIRKEANAADELIRLIVGCAVAVASGLGAGFLVKVKVKVNEMPWPANCAKAA
jgi:hypothetical protein